MYIFCTGRIRIHKEKLACACRACKYGIRLLCVHFLFNLYVDGEHKRLAVNVSVTQGTSEISLCRHLCMPNCTVILSPTEVYVIVCDILFMRGI